MIDSYPLSWPAGWPRTKPDDRVRARFQRRRQELSIFDASWRILDELKKMGVDINDGVILSTNVESRSDGIPRSDRRAPDDPGVAVYWPNPETKQQQCMAIDLYDTVAGNLAAVAATLDAMRAIERHGGAQILKRAFQGFKALPSAGNSTPTMDVQTASVILSNYYPTLTPELVRSDRAALATAVRFARSKVHPDVNGGDVKPWENVETARKVLEAHHGVKV